MLTEAMIHGDGEPQLLRVGVHVGCVAKVMSTAGATEYYLDGEEGLVTVKSSISLTDEQHAFARGRWSTRGATRA